MRVRNEVNVIINDLVDAKQVHYFDVGGSFVNEDGVLDATLTAGFLHPNARGYEI